MVLSVLLHGAAESRDLTKSQILILETAHDICITVLLETRRVALAASLLRTRWQLDAS